MGSLHQVLWIPRWALLSAFSCLSCLPSWLCPVYASSSKAVIHPSWGTPHFTVPSQHVSITKSNSWFNTFPNYDVQRCHVKQPPNSVKLLLLQKWQLKGKNFPRGRVGDVGRRLKREVWGDGSGLYIWSDLPYPTAGLCEVSECRLFVSATPTAAFGICVWGGGHFKCFYFLHGRWLDLVNLRLDLLRTLLASSLNTLFHTCLLQRPLCIWIFPASCLRTGLYMYHLSLVNKSMIAIASVSTGHGSSQKVAYLT